MTAGRRAASSVARGISACSRPSAKRTSISTSRPSTCPRSRKPSLKTRIKCELVAGEPRVRIPMRCGVCCCCAKLASDAARNAPAVIRNCLRSTLPMPAPTWTRFPGSLRSGSLVLQSALGIGWQCHTGFVCPQGHLYRERCQRAIERPASGARRSRRVALEAVVRWHAHLNFIVSRGCKRAESDHSITRSARKRIDCGILTPISRATLRLTSSSNLVGC